MDAAHRCPLVKAQKGIGRAAGYLSAQIDESHFRHLDQLFRPDILMFP